MSGQIKTNRNYDKERFPSDEKLLLVATRTLDAIFEESPFESADFFSLDVEGYEAMIIDKDTFQKYRPAVLCVETKDEELVKVITSQDYRVANRDASVNDIIFVDRRLNEPF